MLVTPQDPRPPKVSVIIASYNSAATIGRCLEALVAQEVEEEYEIIVVDSSPDESVERVVCRFRGVQIHRCRQRRFVGDARNIGAAIARGGVFAFTDADCVVDRAWIS
ncbi:MAG: hypothetical protein C4321_06995 [Chloroflexota bacterium]